MSEDSSIEYLGEQILSPDEKIAAERRRIQEVPCHMLNKESGEEELTLGLSNDELSNGKKQIAEGEELSRVKCPICLIFKTEDIVCTKCGHIFCAECMTQIMNQHPTRCPICKKRLMKNEIRKIFLN